MSNEEIVMQIQGGVDVAKNQERLWLNNKGAVCRIIKSRGISGPDMEDLQQQGFIGLINAARRFDPDGEASFLSYAMPFIRGALYQYMASAYNFFHIPQYMRRRLKAYSRIMNEAAAAGRRLTDMEICSALDIGAPALRELYCTLDRISTYSLDEAIPGGDDESTLLDSIASDEDIEQLVISGVWEQERHNVLQKALSILDGKTREMIKCVYYLGFSLTSVGEMMNCSQSYVGSRIQRGFQKMRREYGRELAEFMYPGFRYHEEEIPCAAEEAAEECNMFLI